MPSVDEINCKLEIFKLDRKKEHLHEKNFYFKPTCIVCSMFISEKL